MSIPEEHVTVLCYSRPLEDVGANFTEDPTSLSFHAAMHWTITVMDDVGFT